MGSRQTLSEDDRRLLALWAADCAARVMPLARGHGEYDVVLADALSRARAFGRGESSAAEEIRKRMQAVKTAGSAEDAASAAAARSVGQAAAVAHMGAHALGAAAYAVKAVSLAEGGGPAGASESEWQVAHLSSQQRAALRRLPPVGGAEPGPLGPGLLSRGVLGETIRTIQRSIGTS